MNRQEGAGEGAGDLGYGRVCVHAYYVCFVARGQVLEDPSNRRREMDQLGLG